MDLGQAVPCRQNGQSAIGCVLECGPRSLLPSPRLSGPLPRREANEGARMSPRQRLALLFLEPIAVGLCVFDACGNYFIAGSWVDAVRSLILGAIVAGHWLVLAQPEKEGH